MEQARALEEKGAIAEAMSFYEEVIRQYPTQTYENEIWTRTYSGDAQERINVLRCRKARGPDFSTVSREELAISIREAIRTGRRKRLMRLASCDFTVGLTESDNTWQVTPEQAARVIISLRRALDWSSQRFEDWGEGRIGIIVAARGGAKVHDFGLQRIALGWRWISYFTSDERLLKRLAAPAN